MILRLFLSALAGIYVAVSAVAYAQLINGQAPTDLPRVDMWPVAQCDSTDSYRRASAIAAARSAGASLESVIVGAR